ncbi:MAG: hypothetical protein AAFX99_31245, partial [Myxococcota bacterium]
MHDTWSSTIGVLTLTVQERLVAVRDLVHRAPSLSAWRALCDLFTRWPEIEDLQVGLDYAEANLDAHWPDALREPDPRWWQRFVRHQSEPRFRLVRAFALSAHHLRELDMLLDAPWLHLIRHMSCRWPRVRLAPGNRSRWNANDATTRLLRAPQLSGLRSLSLGGLSPSLKLLQMLAADELPALRALDLRGCGLTPPLLAALSRGPSQLHQLNLSFNELQAIDLRLLRQAPWQTTLTALDLSFNDLQDGGAATLASIPWSRLGVLKLESNGIRVRGAQDLASSSQFAQLQTLDLSRNPLFVRGSLALGRSSNLDQLREL